MSRYVIPTLHVLVMLILLAFLPVRDVMATPPARPLDMRLVVRVHELAANLSKEPYAGPDRKLPESLQKLDYDAYRKIVYQRSQSIALGKRSDFRLEMFHRGYLFPDRVSIFLNDSLNPKDKLHYKPQLFRFHGDVPSGLTDDLDFAGLRLLYPMNDQPKPGLFGNKDKYLQTLDEVISFVGASYFRALDRGGAYGSSARGLAVNTGLFDRAEEFPVFTKFWFLPKLAHEGFIPLWALLDSPSITGAYQFSVQPGSPTTVTVYATLYPRKPIDKLGIAPLTSMFLYGESGAKANVNVDHRPEVHDADGLMIHSGEGEWLWRPLTNPGEHRVTRFPANSVKGFGLIQRDKNIKHYNDFETNQHQRPSIWVEPTNDWGNGQVELLELASDTEGMDNIGAYWIADKPVLPGEPLHFAYKLTFTHAPLPAHARYEVQDSHATLQPNGDATYTITFCPTALNQPQTDSIPQADISVARGEISELKVTQNTTDGVVTVRFKVHPDSRMPIALRGYLHQGTDAISETWSDQCPN